MKKRPKDYADEIAIKRIIRTWLMQHIQAFVFSLGQLYKQFTNSLLTIAVIGISLALPAGFYLLLQNTSQLIEGWAESAQITLFLDMESTDEQNSLLASKLTQDPRIEKVTVISRDQAMAEYSEISGFREALETLGDNPFPAVLLVQPELNSLSSGNGEELLNYLRSLPDIDTAMFDRQWAKRLFSIIKILNRFVIILAALLSIAVLLVIGNTIRLAIYNRRSEIEITKLFGATNAFIQRPFLYSGLIYGATGSLLSCILLEFSVFMLDSPVQQLAVLYNSNFVLNGLLLSEIIILVSIGGLLGLCGSWLAVLQHLKAIEPV